jgi:hypothetical protein
MRLKIWQLDSDEPEMYSWLISLQSGQGRFVSSFVMVILPPQLLPAFISQDLKVKKPKELVYRLSPSLNIYI